MTCRPRDCATPLRSTTLHYGRPGRRCSLPERSPHHRGPLSPVRPAGLRSAPFRSVPLRRPACLPPRALHSFRLCRPLRHWRTPAGPGNAPVPAYAARAYAYFAARSPNHTALWRIVPPLKDPGAFLPRTPSAGLAPPRTPRLGAAGPPDPPVRGRRGVTAVSNPRCCPVRRSSAIQRALAPSPPNGHGRNEGKKPLCQQP